MADRRPTLSSALSYRDPRAAIAWLEAAFGFETVLLVEEANGEIGHSELRYRDGVIMVGREWDADHRSPASLDGKNTQSIHIHVDSDIDRGEVMRVEARLHGGVAAIVIDEQIVVVPGEE